jgi:O-glycosyl hydrolase
MVTVDISVKHQTVFGWGAGLRRNISMFYNSPATVINQVENLCFNQLHVNIVRSICEPTIEPTQPSVRFPLDSSNLVWNFYSNTKDMYAIQRAKLKSNGRINYIFSTNNSAPAWQKANNSIINGDTILPSKYNYFIDYISYYILGMQNKYHLQLNGISLFNEPGLSTYYESLTSSPLQVKELVIKMRHRLDSMEAVSMIQHIDLIAPESPVVSNTQNYPGSVGNLAVKNCIHYLDSAQGGIFSDTAAIHSVDIVGTHNYFDETNTANWPQLKSVSKNKPIWVTEVCTSTWDPYDISSKNAVEQAKWIHRSFTLADVSAFSMFSYYDTIPADTSTTNIGALVMYHGSTIIVPKRYYGFKQFVNFVKPGYQRVEVSYYHNNLFVSSYINPASDTLIIVAINDTTISLSNILYSCPVSPNPIAEYVTCDNPNYNTAFTGNLAPPLNGNFTSNMQPMSIHTFVLPLNAITGINPFNKQADDLKIFPNPATGIFTIETPQNATINISNIQGRLIKTYSSDSNKINVNVSELPIGVYLVEMETDRGVVVKKFVKE